MSQKSSSERPYLSIGEVLGLLLEEFPDVTISKIRFLESQGLIVPERTASGYRKFYDDDVDRLRYILREQKDKFLPLRIIKDRLDTPPEGLERPAPRGIKNVTTTSSDSSSIQETFDDVLRLDERALVVVSDSGIQGADSLQAGQTNGHPAAVRAIRPFPMASEEPVRRPVPPDPSDRLGRPATYTRAELRDMSGIDEKTFEELEGFGMVAPRLVGREDLFDEHDLAICEVAKGFADSGFDVRLLKAWKASAEREAGLFEQRVLPLLRRRSPEARQEADRLLVELNDLGARLRAILIARALGSLSDGR